MCIRKRLSVLLQIMKLWIVFLLFAAVVVAADNEEEYKTMADCLKGNVDLQWESSNCSRTKRMDPASARRLERPSFAMSSLA